MENFTLFKRRNNSCMISGIGGTIPANTMSVLRELTIYSESFMRTIISEAGTDLAGKRIEAEFI